MIRSMSDALLSCLLFTAHMWSVDNSHVLGPTDLFKRL